MVEMFQTKFWDDLVDTYKETLVGTGSYRAVPYDMQVKVGGFVQVKSGDNKTVIGWDGEQDMFVAGQSPPVMADGCFFGAIVEAENDRFFGYKTEGEDITFEEIDVDDLFLLDTHVLIVDNAIDAQGSDCPNVYKNKKPYKELNLPIILKASNADSFPIVYTVHVHIRKPTDGAGAIIPSDFSFDIPEKETLVPFAKIIMPSIIFVKPECIQSPPTPETGACPPGIGALSM